MGDRGDEGDEVWRDGRLCQPGALAEGFNSSEFRFGVFGVFRGLFGGGRVWGPHPHRCISRPNRCNFLKLFSGQRGEDPATAGCDESEDIGEAGACQGGLTPILHFPHFPTIY